mgnify:CR=1 FL=1
MSKKFKFTIDGKVYHANMVDNPIVHLGDMVEDVIPQLQNAGHTVHILCEVEE